MKTAYLVGKFPQVEHLPPEKQRAAIALARNYGFSKLTFHQYLLRYVALPVGAGLCIAMLPWLFMPFNGWVCLGVTLFAGVAAYWFERYLHREMIKTGLDMYCTNRVRLVALMEKDYRRPWRRR
ncbi:hypothetical protein [Alteromonas oceanisediminis]|uniref:hypothetical protein n=1 Tax=Alteromonas oceanisediminis TaxID=2836180 RepID=UPI001BD938D0|nr:hypothetical protein [Alteromonas oceanisediminis]MBT0585156.1 hypothetical protein [Alteromonas oceanisediminis]